MAQACQWLDQTDSGEAPPTLAEPAPTAGPAPTTEPATAIEGGVDAGVGAGTGIGAGPVATTGGASWVSALQSSRPMPPICVLRSAVR